jgi:hypothetical protein
MATGVGRDGGGGGVRGVSCVHDSAAALRVATAVARVITLKKVVGKRSHLSKSPRRPLQCDTLQFRIFKTKIQTKPHTIDSSRAFSVEETRLSRQPLPAVKLTRGVSVRLGRGVFHIARVVAKPP